ncbi:hypothetical protein RFI_08132 [Reticulomyxa filosa]|uniref:Uncharacterized protein n=1 Tax=Reticulomyxa filosa TaxID=46433 RepID=X6NST1_RETFI|nr:hypothetical protein RFI_08132 [Reticulomyxa filosa]|eukprot:ETO28993.1 hypothetical protein RFI_08132 [Reticulomyxa filosa]
MVLLLALGSGIMLITFDDDEPRVIANLHNRVPTTGWFQDRSVLFTMMDRKIKYLGRKVRVSPDGKHVLCVDLVGNVDIYKVELQSPKQGDETQHLELSVRVNNVWPMSAKWNRKEQIYDCEWFASDSLIVCFVDFSWVILSLPLLQHEQYQSHRDRLFQSNLLGPAREYFGGIPILSRSFSLIQLLQVTIALTHLTHQRADFLFWNCLKIMFVIKLKHRFKSMKIHGMPLKNNVCFLVYSFIIFFLIISYTSRIIYANTENQIYGWRKRHCWQLSSVVTLKPLQLYRRYLENKEHDKAMTLAKHCCFGDEFISKNQPDSSSKQQSKNNT